LVSGDQFLGIVKVNIEILLFWECFETKETKF